jgi:hypothetical protein
MSPLELAMVKSLAYADLFDQALSTAELARYLIDYRLESVEELEAAQYPVSSIKYQDEVWCLAGREQLVELKANQQQIRAQKLAMARRYSWIFRMVPWVKLVCVTGSIAGGSPGADDDIDLLVVTDGHRLWLSRLVVVGLLTLLGRRRKPNDDPQRVNNKLCLNMWLSEDSLASPQPDLYVANELAHMVPIVNRDEMYERYIQANEWVENVLPNFFDSVQRPASSVQKKSTRLLPTLYPLLTPLDVWLERWQLRKMRPRTRERVEDGLLMFHPRDYRSDILQRHQTRLRELGL